MSQSSEPSEAAFQETVSQLLIRIGQSELRKVVLSRTLEMQMDQIVNVPLILAKLVKNQPLGYHFAIPRVDGATLVGVSPELLVKKAGKIIASNPLAGSSRRSQDSTKDEEVAAILARSEKDLYEHQLVIQEVARILLNYCALLSIPERPSIIGTPKMWHLSTRIHGELLDDSQSALRIARAMHPTPAVCGFPPLLAKATIDELETFDRDLFTGMVGWMDSKGNGEWVVTIRCGLVHGNFVRLYAGAGIVKGSVPAKEWDETNVKLGTMLEAFNLYL